jgi:hypothetical protein
MTLIFQKSNLPESSQPWARQIQDQLTNVIIKTEADNINNAARDAQLNSAITSVTSVVNSLIGLGSTGSRYNINADNINAGTIDASAVSVTNLNASNITSGGIDASVIDVTNLDAGNITAGTLTADRIDGGSIIASDINLTSGSYGITVGASGQSAYLNCFVGSGDGTTFGMAGFSGSISGGSPTVTNTGWVAAFYPRNNGGPDLGTSGRRWNTVYATTATINTSDSREKTNIATSELGLDFVNQLNPVSYKRIDGIRTHYGLIAQDVEQVLIDNNITTQEFAGFIRGDVTDPESILGLRYSEFISPMIKAIQELSARVEELEGR